MASEPKKALRSPYRVAVWGPGKMGQAAIREILRLPETELVAVLGYNRENDGADVSKLIGGGTVGIKITTSVETMLAAKPEVVLHTARDFADFRCDDEIIRLLEAGVNVISALPYQYPLARGRDVYDRLVDACNRGGTTLHGTGTNPGFLYERLAAMATGVTNDIQYIKLQEFLRMENHAPEALVPVGFSTTLADMENNNVAAVYTSHYLTMALHFLADKLGMPIDRIELGGQADTDAKDDHDAGRPYGQRGHDRLSGAKLDGLCAGEAILHHRAPLVSRRQRQACRGAAPLLLPCGDRRYSFCSRGPGSSRALHAEYACYRRQPCTISRTDALSCLCRQHDPGDPSGGRRSAGSAGGQHAAVPLEARHAAVARSRIPAAAP